MSDDADRVRVLQLQVVALERDIYAARQALTLQAAEYSRRLDDLNHAHQIASEKDGLYLPKDVFDRFAKEDAAARVALEVRFNSFLPLAVHERFEKDLTEWRRRIDEGIAEARGSRATIVAIASAVIATISILISVVGALERFI